MPCICWYEPPEESKQRVKRLCKLIVAELKLLETEGAPIGLSLGDVKVLLNHLYDEKCDEKPEIT